MPIGDICNRDVITVHVEDTVLQAAKVMRQRHVGDVVVMDQRDGRTVPVGIITDRDVVVELVAPELDPSAITVGDIMVPELAKVKEGAGVFETIQTMCDKGVRRLPVVTDDEQELAGIVTLDDIMMLLAEEFGALTRLVTCERNNEASLRR
ncbi:inosine-5-monophosphate dehydrogenase [Novimethylophilus kurashikiensis]|uniref:Inosine-5-monophosphate dehydrogenase n=1 Tax=Novimethylophilus kurashikiensis TaxID=1825523 RepID=A0A2R5F8V2_9PROT|nr:CBS domain-containing protein [Novimethylophilus kurashikiensis]GBG13343.1 inosine-5-monophosphate dehydrogenase [Novimethylophilus kurashikiensis]